MTGGIAVVLDLHFGKKCNFRLEENMDQVISKKLDFIKDYCIEKEIKTVIFAGDIFENCSINRSTFMSAVKSFKKFKEDNIDVVAIFGNHDEYRYNKNMRLLTPLYDLEELGLVYCKDEGYEIYRNGVRFMCFSYLETQKLCEFLSNGNKDKNNDKDTRVAIGHAFYENEFMGGTEANITKEMLDKSDIDFLVLGHDHTDYEELKVGDKYVLRCGSILRDNTTQNSLNRTPSFYHITRNKQFERIEIPKCVVLKDVVKVENLEKKKEVISYKEIIEEISINEDIEDNVLDAINNLENKEVKDIIRRYI